MPPPHPVRDIYLSQTAWRLTSHEMVIYEPEKPTVVTLLHDLRPDTRYVFEADGFASLEFRTAPCAGLVEATAFSLDAGYCA